MDTRKAPSELNYALFTGLGRWKSGDISVIKEQCLSSQLHLPRRAVRKKNPAAKGSTTQDLGLSMIIISTQAHGRVFQVKTSSSACY
jgi:hypothetical protein